MVIIQLLELLRASSMGQFGGLWLGQHCKVVEAREAEGTKEDGEGWGEKNKNKTGEQKEKKMIVRNC